jgi:hypothetical protein
MKTQGQPLTSWGLARAVAASASLATHLRGAAQRGDSLVRSESSDRTDAERRRVHYSPKKANGKGTIAVQKVGMIEGAYSFTAV